MRRLLPAAVVAIAAAYLFLSLGNREEKPAAPAAAEIPVATPPAPSPATPPAPEPAVEPAPEPAETLLADRRYEVLLKGHRSATYHVRWTRMRQKGQVLVQDVTRVRQRGARMMGGQRDIFESTSLMTTLRTEAGELVSMESVVHQPSRTDRSTTERIAEGYRVTVLQGDNRESFVIETPRATYVDVETFLGPRIRAGTLEAGMKLSYPVLATGRRTVVEMQLEILERDDEADGVKVRESFEGSSSIWWFDAEGAVLRHRAGDTVIRRDDTIDPEDLPANPAAYSITRRASPNLPRLFTGRSMLVDIHVQTDDTVGLPQFADNPWTEVVHSEGNTVRVRLKMHDSETASAKLPIPPEGFADALKATTIMEVDDPAVRTLARRIVGEETDARRAATRIADFVFKHITHKQSPDIPQPTAKRILADRLGDCSEHALLFTTLCRAAGIPARRARGFVCIGPMWGMHAWCEVWVGAWIGADPTTNEIGTRARYVFLGRQDEPHVASTVFLPERTELVMRAAEYPDGTLDLEHPDPTLYCGIRVAEKLPEGWTFQPGTRSARIQTPYGIVYAAIQPDQGYRDAGQLAQRYRAEIREFGSRKGFSFGNDTQWLVLLGREILTLRVRPQGDEPLPIETLIEVLRPTLDRAD